MPINRGPYNTLTVFAVMFILLTVALLPHTLSRLARDEVGFGDGSRRYVAFTNTTMHSGYCDVMYRDLEHIVTSKIVCDKNPVFHTKSLAKCDNLVTEPPSQPQLTIPCFRDGECQDERCKYDCRVEVREETLLSRVIVLPVGARHEPFVFNSTTVPWRVEELRGPVACGYVLAEDDPTKLLHLQFATAFDLNYTWRHYLLGPLAFSLTIAAMIALCCQ